MLELTSLDITHWVGRYLYPFVRIAGFLMVLPLFGTRMVPQRIRMILAVMMTLAIVPILPPFPVVEAMSLGSFLIIAQQLLIGIVLGLAIEFTMQIFVIAGQLISMQTGLAMAQSVNPAMGTSSAVISQWLLFMVILIFLSLNGHLVAMEVLVDSFHSMPVGFDGMNAVQFSSLVNWASWMFAAALVVAIPIQTTLLIVNISFGVVAKAAPQLNIFALGFPIAMIMGLLILSMTMGDFADAFQNYLNELFEFLKKLSEIS